MSRRRQERHGCKGNRPPEGDVKRGGGSEGGRQIIRIAARISAFAQEVLDNRPISAARLAGLRSPM